LRKIETLLAVPRAVTIEEAAKDAKVSAIH
jgi:hypothetical protein